MIGIVVVVKMVKRSYLFFFTVDKLLGHKISENFKMKTIRKNFDLILVILISIMKKIRLEKWTPNEKQKLLFCN